jgi:hypothetical protein
LEQKSVGLNAEAKGTYSFEEVLPKRQLQQFINNPSHIRASKVHNTTYKV